MYCFVQEVTAPIEMYERMHAAVIERVGDRDIGLLVHLSRQSADGFTITEAWRSKAECDRAMAEIVMPVMRELFGDQGPQQAPPMTEFEPCGLIVPAAGVLI